MVVSMVHFLNQGLGKSEISTLGTFLLCLLTTCKFKVSLLFDFSEFNASLLLDISELNTSLLLGTQRIGELNASSYLDTGEHDKSSPSGRGESRESIVNCHVNM